MNGQDKTRLQEIGVEIGYLFSEAEEKVCGKRDAGCGECCTGCAECNGHFQFEGVNQKKHIMEFEHAARQIQSLRSRYDGGGKAGFLTDHGCSIPRWERAVVCQSNICNAIRPLVKSQIERLTELLDEMAVIRKRNNLIF